MFLPVYKHKIKKAPMVLKQRDFFAYIIVMCFWLYDKAV